MITEDYVSLETAKLLKEKGFEEATFHCYTPKKVLYFEDVLFNHNSGTDYSAPTLQMAMKWLREVHNIVPVILIGGYTSIPPYYWFRIDKINDGKWEDSVYRDETKRDTYEEACEEAIKYCLKKLI